MPFPSTFGYEDPPGPGAGCPIGDGGQRLVVQGFWNQSAVKRFGSDLFGSDTFGGAEGPTEADWVDLTVYASDLTFSRGDNLFTANPQTDRLTFLLRDDSADIVDWLPPTSLASPTVGTPFRVGFIDAGGDWFPMMVGRLESMADDHSSPLRQIVMSIAGTKTDLSTPLLDPDRPSETTRQRVEWVLAEIGWLWGVAWPADPLAFDTDLFADPDATGSQRTGPASYAWNIVTEAVNSSGYNVSTDNGGQLTFETLAVDDVTPPAFTITDCHEAIGPGVDVVASQMEFTANASQVLNVVQLQNRININRSGYADDATSILLFGRRASGYGFPVVVVNQSELEADVIAEGIRDQLSFLVSRVDSVFFSTGTDPTWWEWLDAIMIGTHVAVYRSEPKPLTFQAKITGFDIDVTPEFVECQLHLMALNPTF